MRAPLAAGPLAVGSGERPRDSAGGLWLTRAVPASRPLLHHLVVLLYLAVCAAVLVRDGRGRATGDGHEYYAMLFALGETGRPSLTPKSEAAYEAYAATHPAIALEHQVAQRRDVREMTLPDGTADFPHAWFYSLLAVPFYAACKLVGADAAYSFTLLHLALLGLALWVAQRCFGRTGALAALLLCVASPALWFINKAHTEFFTVTLTLVVCALFLRGRYVQALVPLAALSTQNPPFLALLALCGLQALLLQRDVLLTARGLLTAGVAAGLAAVVPAYYLVRHGVPNPLFKTTAVTPVHPDLKRVLAVFVDPDIGLVPNWPLAALLALLAAVLVARRPRASLRTHLRALPFFAAWVGLFAYAHAKTVNLNHGGTISMSRYALWYAALLLPALVVVLRALWQQPPARRWALGGLLGAGFVATAAAAEPRTAVRTCEPAPLARALYRVAPGLYDPPTEIFLERNSGLCEGQAGAHPWAVFNPDCTKLLLVRENLPPEGGAPPPVLGCQGFLPDGPRVAAEARRYFASHATGAHGYVPLRAGEAEERFGNFPLYPLGSALHFGAGPQRFAGMGQGWSHAEEWGTWTDGALAELFFQLDPPPQPAPRALTLQAGAFVGPGKPRLDVVVELNGWELGRIEAEQREPRSYRFEVPPQALRAQNRLRLHIDRPRSPSELGESGDGRRLGLSVLGMQLGG
ncbi:hypothetical protein FGE12_05915 [Aggregicoccus sp. 17bor-14]|uniref:hypothetical protein n=1 Tax=Myxococcaceae TaxID=31 RepID=UPI00129CFA7B|nr:MULTISPECIES: hypothetical protein [Myxococcaceae]MBF5041920.1 hypothetical protein [Simulacricoccus sp. 17bor-14]MRI87701.1 hypothetical protein [Aggregicoccus sp. 17bor-14]